MRSEIAGNKFLIIDDRREHIQLLKDLLKPFCENFLEAVDGWDGVQLARRERPTLVVLDHNLGGGITSDKIIVELRKDRITAVIPILVVSVGSSAELLALSSGADEYLRKEEEVPVFQVRVKNLLKRLPNPDQNRCMLTITAEHAQLLAFAAAGIVDVFGSSSRLTELEPSEISRLANNNLDSPDWKFNIPRTAGKIVHEAIFGHSEVAATYNYVRGFVKNDGAKLQLRFRCKRAELGVPFELMVKPGGANQDQQWLALEHPLDRSLAGTAPAVPPISASFLMSRKKDEPLSVLVIASNSDARIPGADLEAEWMRDSISGIFREADIRAEVTCIPSPGASIGRIREILRACQFDIVHYSGHGTFSKNNTDKSALWFRDDTAVERPVPLISTELQNLLKNSRTRFVYLSCCYGTSAGSVRDLEDHDFLGIADAVIGAGVPSAIGFRRPVSDQGAVQLARAFYASLAREKEIGLALYLARRELHSKMPDDNVWLSPILIQQN
jgi:DNA-binding response OmpR family regulator